MAGKYFNGQWYGRHGLYSARSEAKTVAARLRAKGHKARVEKDNYTKAWVVYTA